MDAIAEHSVSLSVKLPPGPVHRGMETFYNPLMISNRNIAVLLLNSISSKSMNMADPLAGSGIRSLRFLRELNQGKINHLFINDMKENFEAVFHQSLKLNGLKPKNVSIFQQDASSFLMNRVDDAAKPSGFCGYFDYIDLDPFGSPNPFLSAAIAKIARHGIIAVTATDTAALTGTYPLVTQRKYWATPLKNYLMHEIGLRILIRKVQLLGMQFDKALTPLLSYHKEHYLRIYFQSEKGKEQCDTLVNEHQYFWFCQKCFNFKTSTFNNGQCSCGAAFLFAGPLWVGPLQDKKLILTMAKKNPFPEEQKFLDLLREESKLKVVGFYDSHEMAHRCRKEPLPMETVLRAWKGVRTHFSPTGVKTKRTHKEVAGLYAKSAPK